VTGRGLGKFVAPFWLLFGFMIAAYFVGGVGHGLKNVSSRTLIHTRIAPERHGRASQPERSGTPPARRSRSEGWLA
jgi:hypothetical protein